MTKLSKIEWAILGLTLVFFGLCLGYFAWQNRPQELPIVLVEQREGQTIIAREAPAAPGMLEGERMNINEAPVEDLVRLPGIGEKRAADIVAYRTQVGTFVRVEDIMAISGIGEATFLKLADYICVTQE